MSEIFLCGESEELTPSNPFLENQQKESALELALQELQVNKIHSYSYVLAPWLDFVCMY